MGPCLNWNVQLVQGQIINYSNNPDWAHILSCYGSTKSSSCCVLHLNVVQTVRTISDFKPCWKDENNTRTLYPSNFQWLYETFISVKHFVVLSQMSVHLYSHAQPHPIPHVYSTLVKAVVLKQLIVVLWLE